MTEQSNSSSLSNVSQGSFAAQYVPLGTIFKFLEVPNMLALPNNLALQGQVRDDQKRAILANEQWMVAGYEYWKLGDNTLQPRIDFIAANSVPLLQLSCDNVLYYAAFNSRSLNGYGISDSLRQLKIEISAPKSPSILSDPQFEKQALARSFERHPAQGKEGMHVAGVALVQRYVDTIMAQHLVGKECCGDRGAFWGDKAYEITANRFSEDREQRIFPARFQMSVLQHG
jgi:hypothetical protein